MSTNHLGNTQPAIDQEEHTHIGGVAGKKTFVIDNAANQITDFGGERPRAFYQNVSLVSGYSFYGLATPGSNPTTSNFRILRSDTFTGGVLYADGSTTFTHAWSSASLASISYS